VGTLWRARTVGRRALHFDSQSHPARSLVEVDEDQQLPSLAIVLAQVVAERETMNAHAESLDGKAGVVLGFSGVLVGLGATAQIAVSGTMIFEIGLAVAVVAAILAAWAFLPRRYPVTPAGPHPPESATKRVADRRADLGQDVIADLSDRTGERCLSDRVEAVAVDGRGSLQANLDVVDGNLRCQTPDRCGHLGNGHELADVEDLGSREQENGSPLATDLHQPELAAPHGSPHASAAVQKVPPRSGCLRYASRSDRSNAARTASATPCRAAAEMLTPS